MKLRFGYVSRNQTMSSMKPIPRARISVVVGAALLLGCASSNAGQPAQEAPPASPLSGLAGRQIVVLPAQLIATAGPGGSWDVRPEAAPLLPLIDEELTDAFRKRGVRANWTFAGDLIAAATRNAGLAGNPLGLSVAGIRRWRAGDTPLPEPLASEIRTLVSLTSARNVILPLETRVDLSTGQRKGTLHILLIDSRTARVLWVGDVEGPSVRDPALVADALSPYGFRLMARELAGLFADMVVTK